MSNRPTETPERPEQRLLPDASAATHDAAPSPRPITASAPARQLQELPRDELQALAEDFGLDSSRYPTPQHLVAAIHERRQLIASLDREAMLDIVKWGRRPVPSNAGREQLAQEIARIKTMRFSGLSHRGLLALAQLRGARVSESDDIPTLTRRLKKQEGLFARLNRKRRGLLGAAVSKLIGEDRADSEYQFLPPQGQGGAGAGPASPPPPPPPRPSSVKEEIEEGGLFGGIAGRIKRSADSYVNQKLDEVEARIDRKLDEIDRRLAEWRDKEIANRIRILKITLWVTVIVATASLIYSYLKIYWS